MTRTEFRAQAENLVKYFLVCKKEEDAIQAVMTDLKAAYDKGWNDKQRQLSQSTYPREKTDD